MLYLCNCYLDNQFHLLHNKLIIKSLSYFRFLEAYLLSLLLKVPVSLESANTSVHPRPPALVRVSRAVIIGARLAHSDKIVFNGFKL